MEGQHTGPQQVMVCGVWVWLDSQQDLTEWLCYLAAFSSRTESLHRHWLQVQYAGWDVWSLPDAFGVKPACCSVQEAKYEEVLPATPGLF